ncbi:hypothetical protein L195_g062417, partial [Trifolium pratense]
MKGKSHGVTVGAEQALKISNCPDWDANANYAEFGSEEEMLLMAFSDMNTEYKHEA